MTRIVSCPYCGYNLPARGFVMYCPVCDERIRGPETLPPYRPLQIADYGKPAPAPVAIIMTLGEEPETDREREAETQSILLALQPWYLRTGPILLALFFLTPLGLLLLWAQRPRRPLLGGTFRRLLLSLLFGGAWLGVLVFADLQGGLTPIFQRWGLQSGSQLEGAADPASLGVTQALYGSIKAGDRYETVKSLLGAEGYLLSQSHMDGVPGVLPSMDTTVYEWYNPDGSVIHLIFQNGVLAQKKAYGLMQRDSPRTSGK